MVASEDDSLDALECELNQMGLSVDDLQPPEDGRFDRRAMARVESARIMSRRFIERDRVKERILSQNKVRGRYAVAASVRGIPRQGKGFKGTAWAVPNTHSGTTHFCVDRHLR